MEEIWLTTWYEKKNVANNGINYQPQLVSWISSSIRTQSSGPANLWRAVHAWQTPPAHSFTNILEDSELSGFQWSPQLPTGCTKRMLNGDVQGSHVAKTSHASFNHVTDQVQCLNENE